MGLSAWDAWLPALHITPRKLDEHHSMPDLPTILDLFRKAETQVTSISGLENPTAETSHRLGTVGIQLSTGPKNVGLGSNDELTSM